MSERSSSRQDNRRATTTNSLVVRRQEYLSCASRCELSLSHAEYVAAAGSPLLASVCVVFCPVFCANSRLDPFRFPRCALVCPRRMPVAELHADSVANEVNTGCKVKMMS